MYMWEINDLLRFNQLLQVGSPRCRQLWALAGLLCQGAIRDVAPWVLLSPIRSLWWSNHGHLDGGIAILGDGVCCVYLPFSALYKISISISRRGRDHSNNPRSLIDGPFRNQYPSIILQLLSRQVGFVLIRNIESICAPQDILTSSTNSANHFFAVVFNYDSQRAYSFGASGQEELGVTLSVTTESDWDRWYGLELWKDLTHYLGWGESLKPLHEVNVISKEWKQVSDLTAYDGHFLWNCIQNGYDYGMYATEIMLRIIKGDNTNKLLNTISPISFSKC